MINRLNPMPTAARSQRAHPEAEEQQCQPDSPGKLPYQEVGPNPAEVRQKKLHLRRSRVLLQPDRLEGPYQSLPVLPGPVEQQRPGAKRYRQQHRQPDPIPAGQRAEERPPHARRVAGGGLQGEIEMMPQAVKEKHPGQGQQRPGPADPPGGQSPGPNGEQGGQSPAEDQRHVAEAHHCRQAVRPQRRAQDGPRYGKRVSALFPFLFHKYAPNVLLLSMPVYHIL